MIALMLTSLVVNAQADEPLITTRRLIMTEAPIECNTVERDAPDYIIAPNAERQYVVTGDAATCRVYLEKSGQCVPLFDVRVRDRMCRIDYSYAYVTSGATSNVFVIPLGGYVEKRAGVRPKRKKDAFVGLLVSEPKIGWLAVPYTGAPMGMPVQLSSDESPAGAAIDQNFVRTVTLFDQRSRSARFSMITLDFIE